MSGQKMKKDNKKIYLHFTEKGWLSQLDWDRTSKLIVSKESNMINKNDVDDDVFVFLVSDFI
jgi:hypothetical protein